MQGRATGVPPGLNAARIHKGCQGKMNKIVRCVPYFFLPFAAQDFPVPECSAALLPLHDGQLRLLPWTSPCHLRGENDPIFIPTASLLFADI